MLKKAIVTLADANYFELLIELIESIKRFPGSKEIKICVLDAGLSSDQIKTLSSKVHNIKKSELGY
jgi:lipopolysaccharide biosynthesis glycosyltransferase